LYHANADETFAEYELDYIIFAKKHVGEFIPNPDEVKNFEWVSRKDVPEFLAERSASGEDITPWFRLINES
jgi:isopentenyldiphosphate isomerase